MIKTRIYKNNNIELCETYSSEGYKLLQKETQKTYGSKVVDVIKDYEDGKPQINFSYIETEEKEEDSPFIKESLENGEYIQIIDILSGEQE